MKEHFQLIELPLPGIVFWAELPPRNNQRPKEGKNPQQSLPPTPHGLGCSHSRRCKARYYRKLQPRKRQRREVVACSLSVDRLCLENSDVITVDTKRDRPKLIFKKER
ncbi:hypothetical protein M9H77_32089 [Catharanthus roseus]|uniref:Uncharacterized protein n=1 Tax=Catharanthus roseus TaxID=4058 RepID=A0ACC0A4L0_CATRO|nr:hypothetical protein M9H77_32089 [Catharanthus roseus]